MTPPEHTECLLREVYLQHKDSCDIRFKFMEDYMKSLDKKFWYIIGGIILILLTNLLKH